MNKLRRNRIVIDFAKATAVASRARQGGGALRILIVIVVVLVLIFGGVLGGAYFWWRSYQKGPAYSLALLVDAAQRNDRAAIDTVLDNDKVTEDFVSQVRQRTSGSFSAAVNSLFSNQADSIASNLSPKLKETLHDQIIQEVRRISEPAAGKPFFLVALFIPRFVDIKQENEVAHAVVNVKDERIQLTMNAAEARWRVVTIQDDKLAQLVADGIKKNLSTSGTQIQDEIRKQLEKIQPTK